MASFNKYKTKKGTKWRFEILTGYKADKQTKVTRGGFNSKREAKAAADQYEEQLQHTGFVDNERITFGEVYRQWFESYKLTVKESTWVTTDRNMQNHVLPLFDHRPIAQITSIQCQQAVNDWFNEPLKKYGLFFSTVCRVFEYAVKMQIITNNPTNAVFRPKARQLESAQVNDQNMYYTREELKAFLECTYDNDNYQAYAFFRLLAFTGARKGELLALQYTDVNFKDNCISINKTQSNGKFGLVVQSPKTSASNRTLYLDEKTMKILKKWRQLQRKELLMLGFNTMSRKQLVFASQKNQMHSPGKPRVWMVNVTDKYDLKHIPVHGFRHTYATLAIQGGMPPKELQVQLGHSNIKTTLDIYTSATEQQRKSTPQQFVSLVNF